jgi:hypothetical protein
MKVITPKSKLGGNAETPRTQSALDAITQSQKRVYELQNEEMKTFGNY